jgi:hypothetical protein
MRGRNREGRILVAVGSIVLFASAALHWFGAYPGLSKALGASNLNADLQPALRVTFLLLGWDWVVIGIVALLAAFTDTKLLKILVLICGLAVLVEAVLTLVFIGVFVGNEMIGSAAVLLIIGGVLVQNDPANHRERGNVGVR